MMNKLLRFFAVLLAALVPTFHAGARTYIVTDTNDTLNVTSLRGAIIAATSPDRDWFNTIILGSPASHWRGTDGPVYHLTLAGADETNSRTGDLDISRGYLAIIGLGTNVTIDATGLGDRVFNVFPQAQLSLGNITITGGAAPQAQYGSFYHATLGAGHGGAIYNAGSLFLDHCTITGNSSGDGNFNPGNGWGSDGGDGGGIYNSGKLWMNNCVIQGNSTGAGMEASSGGNGGGLRNDGVGYLTASTIIGNASGNGGGPDIAIGIGGSGGDGGGIYNAGTLILNNCLIGTNSCGSGSDGGQPGISWIFSSGGAGGSGGSGGGVYNAGKIYLNFCTVSGNGAGNGGSGGSLGYGGGAGSGGSGGGIVNVGSLNLNTCTLSGNVCGNGGNGAWGEFSGGNGGAGGGGGGIYNEGPLQVTSSTIVLNQAGGGGNAGSGGGPYIQLPLRIGDFPASGGSGGSGGGILNLTSNNMARMRNTLVALNAVSPGGWAGTNIGVSPIIIIINGPFPPTNLPPEVLIGTPGENGTGLDLSGSYTSQGFNLVGVLESNQPTNWLSYVMGGVTSFTNGVKADQVGSLASPIDPRLGPLQMNGGPTPTHALLAGSPAIDQGRSFGIQADQRGYPRPHDNHSVTNAPGGDGCDIGAYESDSTPYRTGLLFFGRP